MARPHSPSQSQTRSSAPMSILLSASQWIDINSSPCKRRKFLRESFWSKLTKRLQQKIFRSPTKCPRSNISAAKSFSYPIRTSISKSPTRAICRSRNSFSNNARPTTSIRDVSNKIDKLLQSIVVADLAQLMSIWRARQTKQWSQSPESYRLIAKKMLQQGEPLLAFDVVTEGLSAFPDDVRLRQLQGLALARSGATDRANTVLESLRRDGQTDEETLGMLGRTYKDLATDAATKLEREKFLRRAADIYGQAYQLSGGYWTGINAATMDLLVGETERACQIAKMVRAQCLKEVQDPGGDQYWELAALGEAALICREWGEAEEWYARAAKEAAHRFGDIHSSRRNARLILQHWDEDSSKIDNYLHVPAVIVFAGHMIDRPERAIARFPSDFEPVVAKKICARIDKLQPGFGFASAACGSDILFLEAMLDVDAEVSVVLPYGREEFVRDSVDFIAGSNWCERFDRVLERAARVSTASTQKLEIGGVSYEFCNELLLGLAAIHARQLDAALIPLAVWDGVAGDGPGGAASVVRNWQNRGYKPEIIDLAKISVESVAALHERRPDGGHRPPLQTEFASRVVAILFADAVGFSKLTESEVPRFVQHFLGAIAELSEKFGETI